MTRLRLLLAAALLCGLFVVSTSVHAQTPAIETAAGSAAQLAVAQAASQGKFSLIVFYRDDNDLARAMAQVVTATTTQRPDSAVATFVQITNPAEQAIVKPGGTGTPRLVISARLAPLPPRMAFMSFVPSAAPPPKK